MSFPSGVKSKTRLHTVWISWWSWEATSTLHFTASRPLFRAAMDSRSRWLVGWSSMSTLAPESIIRESMHRTFSPPERTLTGLYTSSPEKSIRPRKPRRYCSWGSLEYWRSHCTRLSSLSWK